MEQISFGTLIIPQIMNLNGTDYYYIRNAKNDMIGLIDDVGAEVVSYTYDSCAKLISIDGSLKDTVGVKNPYRYRGYRYDTETGFYYLQSRYYSSEWGRFINGDDLGILKLTTGKLLSHNLFTYCGNDPVNKIDPSGFDSGTIITNTLNRLMRSNAKKNADIFWNEGIVSAHLTFIKNVKSKGIWDLKRKEE